MGLVTTPTQVPPTCLQASLGLWDTHVQPCTQPHRRVEDTLVPPWLSSHTRRCLHVPTPFQCVDTVQALRVGTEYQSFKCQGHWGASHFTCCAAFLVRNFGVMTPLISWWTHVLGWSHTWDHVFCFSDLSRIQLPL